MLGENIKTYIKERGITVRELSEKTEIPEPSIKNMIYGLSTNPRADSIIKIAKVLKCAPQELLREEKVVRESPQENYSLYQETAKAVESAAKQKNIDISNHKLRSFYINEVYRYSVANAKPDAEPTVDTSFVNWIVGKNIQS
jgi:transcriptional regulator with XRE-family HTH domain